MYAGVLLFVLAGAQLQPTPPTTKVIPWGGSDFIQYYVTSRLLLNDQNPYDRSQSEELQKQLGRENWLPTYSTPWSLIPALPTGVLSFEHAVQANLIINGLLLLLCFLAWVNLLLPKNKELYLMLAPAVLLWVPTIYVFGMGQNSLWVLMGFTGWLWFQTRQAPVRAGACLALLVIKPHTGLLLGLFAGCYLLRQRQWRAILAALVTLAITALIPCLFHIKVWSEYLESLRTVASTSQYYSATLDGWIRLHISNDVRWLSFAWWGLGMLIAAVLGWRCGGKSQKETSPKDLVRWSTMLCIATIAMVPHAFTYDFVILLPGYLLAVSMALLRTDKRWPIVLIIWIGMIAWLMYGKSNQWQESAYCFIPWAGLMSTCWVLFWSPLHRAVGSFNARATSYK